MSNSVGIIILASYGPTYLANMLHVNIKTNGLLSGLPMFSRYVGGVLLSLVADFLLARGLLGAGAVRRVFNSVSQVGPALAIVFLVPSGCSVFAVVSLLVVGMFLNGSIASGHFANHMDLSPNFAGTLLGISNTFSGGLVGILTPIVVGAIFEAYGTGFAVWNWVFCGTAVVYVVGNLIYVLVLSGETQEWNHPKESLGTRSEEEKEMLRL